MILVIERLLGKSALYKSALSLSGNFHSISAILILLYWILSFVQFFIRPSTLKQNESILAHSACNKNLHNCFYHSWLLSSILVAIPMVIDLVLDHKYIKFSAWGGDAIAWLKRLFVVAAILIPNLVVCLAIIKEDDEVVPLFLYLLNKVQILTVIGCVLGSLFGHKFEQIGDKVPKFIEVHTVSSLSYFVAVEAFIVLEIVFQSNMLVASIFNKLQLIFGVLGGLEIFYLTGVAYYFARKTTVNGRHHCAHCLSAAFQIKAVFIYTNLHFLLYGLSGNTSTPNSSSSPLWYLVSVRIVQILLTYTLNSLPSRAYKLSATLKKEALESRLNLIGYLSHEMRSPLNTTFLGLEYITGEMIAIREKIFQFSSYSSSKISQLIQFEDFISVDLVDNIVSTSNLVMDSCRIATSTLDDLLTADKIGDGKLVLNTTQCNPWSVINKCVESYSIHAHEKNIALSVEGIDHVKPSDSDIHSEYSIEADAFKISQVIRNLLSNALKFTPSEGKVAVLVEILPTELTTNPVQTLQGTQPDHVLRLSVTDSGPGISIEDQQKLFGKYVQINANTLQNGKGSGLGLWISKKIMELHGGNILGTSDGLGKGSTFSIELPLFEGKGTLTIRDDVEYTDLEFGNSISSFQVIQLKPNNATVNERPTTNKNRRKSSKVVPLCDDDNDIPCQLMDSMMDSHSLTTSSSQVVQHQTHKLPAHNLISKHPIINHWNSALRILIVDDSVTNRKVMKRLLASHGHSVTEAVDGVEFLHCLGYEIVGEKVIQTVVFEVHDNDNNNNTFDVILIDDNMPRMNGSQAVSLIRKAGYNGIIIGITGNAETESIQRFKEKGADDVMSKPIDLQQLKTRIVILLARKNN